MSTLMHFALDARTAAEHFPGIGRYVVNLARAMAPLLRDDERLILLHDPSRPSPWDLKASSGKQVEVTKIAAPPFSFQQQWTVPRLLRRLGADLYHSPYYLMPYRPGAPTLVTIHDLIPLRYPEYFTVAQRLIFAVTVRLAARAAHRVVAVSRATAHDLQQLLRLPDSRVAVIPEAADPAFYPRSAAEITAIRQKHHLPERYLLYLGSNKPHKNLKRLVEAWALVQPKSEIRNPKLAIAGVWDPRYAEPRKRARALGLEESIIWLGPVPEADLPALYTGAAVFVFPSLYEGFGLPVLEAMACGTPVGCADTSSLPEVAGEAALFFDPTDVESIADTLGRLLSDAERRAEMRERSLHQASRFSWEQTARETLNLYREITA